MPKPIGLGRGLDALIPQSSHAEPDKTPVAIDSVNALGATAIGSSGVLEVAVNDIHPNPHQPRNTQTIAQLKLEELAASIKEHGVIQPIIVTRAQGTAAQGDVSVSYTLIAGERRWRAAKLANLETVPVIIKDAAPQQMMELALIENIQRSDLSPMEEAHAYQALMQEYGLTQEQVADRVGKERSTITNTVRLLKLPASVQQALMDGKITEGHARALLSQGMTADWQIHLVEEFIVPKGLNVRQTEALVKQTIANAPGAQTNKPKPSVPKVSLEDRQVETRLRDSLGTKVNLQRGRKGNGRIVIEFYSDEEFSAIFDKIVGETE